jgi:hypothetical protein
MTPADADRSEAAGQEHRRPYGVTAIAIICFVYAVFLTVVMLFALIHPEFFHSSNNDRNYMVAAEVGFLTPIRIGLAVILGYGLWFLRRWARGGMVFFAGMDIVGRFSVIDRFTKAGRGIGRQLTSWQELEVAIAILVMAYLISSKKLNRAFEVGPQSDD